MTTRLIIVALSCNLFLAADIPPDLIKNCPVFLNSPQPSASCGVNPGQLSFDVKGNGWLLDEVRVLRFPGLRDNQSATNLVADVVLGQPNFTSLSGGDCHDCNLFRPDKLAVDGQGAVWVDYHNAGIFRFSPPFMNYQKADFGVPYLGNGGLVFDSSGNFWIAEAGAKCDRVLRFSPPFSASMKPNLVLGQPAADACSPPAPGPNRLSFVTAIAFDHSGNLYVADNGSSRIAIFVPPFRIRWTPA